MRGRRILFHDPDPKILRTAERALIATGSDVEIVCGGGDEQELVTRLEREKYDLLMINFDPPVRADPRWHEIFNHIGERMPSTRLVLHATAQSEDYLPLLAERRFVRNLIAKNNEPLEPEELITTAEKLLRGDLFGLEKYLLWGVEPIRLEIRESRAKLDYVRRVTEYAERLGCNERTIGLVESIADELITNAIYNAPRDAAGRPRYARLHRREPVVLEPHEVAHLEFACDGNYIAIAQRDPFGSLTQETIVGYLNRCLVFGKPGQQHHFDEGGGESAASGSGGAGIGLYRVFQSLSKFIVNIDPGKATEVIALIDLRVNMKKFRQQPKSFHIFIADGFGDGAAEAGAKHV